MAEQRQAIAQRPPGFRIAEPAQSWPWWRAWPSAVGIGLLKLYRKIVSPLYGQVCQFYPSCSAYALEAVTTHGLLKGSWLSLRRLVRCTPWGGGIDHVPPGHRYFPPGEEPEIIKLNHPPLVDESEVPTDDAES